MRTRCIFGLAIWTVLVLAGSGAWGAASGQAVRHPDPAAALAERFAWGMREGSDAGNLGFWVGYSIKRLMGERSFIGSWSTSHGDDRRILEDIIEGRVRSAGESKDASAAVKEAARRALDDLEGKEVPDRQVLKDIGILLKMTKSAGRAVQDVEVSDLKLRVRLEGLPLIWLGPAADAESATFLASMVRGAGDRVREHLIHAIAMHPIPDVVVPFLEGVLASSEPARIRRAAAFGLGEQDDPRAPAALAKVLKSSAPLEVKRAAVWGLAENEQPAALEALIDAATSSAETAVRKEAVQGLAEKASDKAVRTLERVAFDDKETEVQKHALFALAEHPAKEALPFLVRVAKTHQNREVRKAAIFALGDLGGPEAVAALAEIARGRTE